MAAGFVKQYTGGSSSAQTTGTALTITAPAAGNVLVAVIALGSSTSTAQVSSIATTGGTWVNVARSAMNAGNSVRTEIWVCTGTITGTSITPTFSASAKWAANVQEWSGLSGAVDVTAVTGTPSVPAASTLTTSPALSSLGGDLVIGGMALARSNASTDFTFTSGSPDACTALTWKGSGGTTASNVGLQALYAVASKGYVADQFNWRTVAAWDTAWAVVTLRATVRTYDALAAQAPMAPLQVSQPALLSDTFARPDQSDWGTGTDGNTWTLQAGPTPLLSISGNEGTYGYVGASTRLTYGPSVPADAEALWRFNMAGNLAAGLQLHLQLRAVGTTSAAVECFLDAGANTLRVQDTGTGGPSAFSSAISVTTGVYYWMRLRVVGTQAWVRLWQDGNVEPVAWNLSLSGLVTTAAGFAGLNIFLEASGQSLTLDHFSVSPVPTLPHAITLHKWTVPSSLSAALAAVLGGPPQQYVQALAATLQQTTARTKVSSHTLVASCVAGAQTARQSARALTAGCTATPTTLHQVNKALAASCVQTVLAARTVGKTLAGVCSTTSARAQQIAHGVLAPLTQTVSVVRTTAHPVASRITGTASRTTATNVARSAFTGLCTATIRPSDDPVFVALASGYTTGLSAPTTKSVATTAPIAAGATLVALSVTTGGSTTASSPGDLTDSAGNTWTRIGGTSVPNSTKYGTLWYCAAAAAVAAGTTTTFTLAVHSPNTAAGLDVWAISALAASPLDQSFFGTASTASVSHTVSALAAAHEVVFVGTVYNSGTVTATAGTGYTTGAVLGTQGSTLIALSAYLADSGTGSTVAVTYSESPATDSGLLVATFLTAHRGPALTYGLARTRLAATLTGTAVRVATVGRALAALLAGTSARTQGIAHALAASCPGTASRAASLARGLSAPLAAAPALLRALARGPFVAPLSASALLARLSTKGLDGALLGTLGRCIRLLDTARSAMLGASAGIARGTGTARAGIMGGAGTLLHATQHVVSASISGAVAFTQTFGGGALGFSKDLAATLSGQGTRTLGVLHTQSAQLSGQVALFSADVRMVLAASLGAAAAITRAGAVGPSAVLSAASQLRRTVAHVLSGTISSSAAFVTHRGAQLAQVLAGALGASGLLRRGTDSRLPSTLVELSSTLTRGPQTGLASMVGGAGDIGRQVAHGLGALLALLGNQTRFGGTLPYRARLSVRSRLWSLLARARAQHIRLGPRAHTVRAPQRARDVQSLGRAKSLRSKGDGMRLVATDPTAPLTIAPDEQNLIFTADFTADLPTGATVATSTASVQRSDGTDVSAALLVDTTLVAPAQVVLVVGTGVQQPGEVYRVHVRVVCSNAPPTRLSGYFDLLCVE